MAEETDPNVSVIELQEEFLEHYERGGKKIRLLALVATLAGGYFALAYFLQLVVLPYVLGITSQTVNLVDPSLMVLEAASLIIALLWFVAGLRDLTFANRVSRKTREIRARQAELAKKYGLGG
ncbi:MAG: hypothetical protein JRN06_11415 [Nitrososphaerota archaeon]|nr:hypothetical protein [Nitrososphaerota archaeon]MDG7024708.1 hypothetical protein [Nitrososphaerota archaeon]